MSGEQDDPELDREGLSAVQLLTAADVEAIDQSLVANSNARWRKVAYVVGSAMGVHSERFRGIPDIYFAARVKALVSLGTFEAQGNLSRMRFSEIRLTSQGLPP